MDWALVVLDHLADARDAGLGVAVCEHHRATAISGDEKILAAGVESHASRPAVAAVFAAIGPGKLELTGLDAKGVDRPGRIIPFTHVVKNHDEFRVGRKCRLDRKSQAHALFIIVRDVCLTQLSGFRIARIEHDRLRAKTRCDRHPAIW